MPSRPTRPQIAPLVRAFALGAAAFAWPAGGARAQNFVAVPDSANPIVAATVTGAYTGAAWVDADGDGLLDLFIVRKATMFRNLGGWSFTAMNAAVPNQGGALGTTWADADNDGDLDVFLSGSIVITNGSNYYRNDGGFAFTKITTGDIGNTVFNSGWGCAFGDVDNDAYADLVVAAANGFGGVTHTDRLLLNNGDGSFTNDVSTPITDLLDAHTVPAWSDYDMDGDVDLFIGSGEVSQLSPDNLFRNLFVENGSLGFERITTEPIATDLADGQNWNWVDYDNDGDLDAYLTNYNTPLANFLYRNDGGAFVRMTTAEVGPIADGTTTAGLANLWGDFDNDGDLDCLVTNDGGAACDYYINDGDGTFTEDSGSAIATSGGPHYGATSGDVDRDGDLDLYVQGTTATKRLYRNDLANGNSWLEIALVGAGAPAGSNRSALGARVRAVATIDGSPVAQLREVSAQNSFNSMNMLDVHLGFGDAAVIDTLEVTWPAGGVETFVSVAVDQRLTIVEGESASGAPSSSPSHGLLLRPNRPNPFSSETQIEFELPRASHARLVVHDVAGRTVRTLLDEELGGGRHSVRWDAKDGAGRAVASGVYFVKLLEAGGERAGADGTAGAVATRRVTVAR